MEKIPFDFYFRVWIKNSILAIGTSFLIILLIRVFFIFYPWTTIIPFIIFEVIIIYNLTSRKAASVEYEFRNYEIEKQLKSYIKLNCGVTAYLRYMLNQLGQLSPFHTDLCKKILIDETDQGIRFSCHIKMAEAAAKEYSFDLEIKYLLEAAFIYPENFTSNYKLGMAYEKAGKDEKAIEYYESALKDQSLIHTIPIKKFISNQVQRIKLNGSNKRPPNLGLRYMTW